MQLMSGRADDLRALADELGKASVDDLIDLLGGVTLGPQGTVVAAALAKELRLLSLGVDGPTTVEGLPHRQVRRALQVGAEAFTTGHGAAERLRPWLVPSAAWEERLAARRAIEQPALDRLLSGRLVESVHVDYGYPGTGAVHATIVLDTGDVVLVDCRDRVSGYEHDFRVEMARTVHDPAASGARVLATIVGRQVDAIVDLDDWFDIVIESLPRIYYLTADGECVLVWRTSPVPQDEP
jgi:hypothetical protein